MKRTLLYLLIVASVTEVISQVSPSSGRVSSITTNFLFNMTDGQYNRPMLQQSWLSGVGDYLSLKHGGNNTEANTYGFRISDGHGFDFGRNNFATSFLKIKTDGNVGIGTTNPTRKLDVNGPIGSQDFLVVQTGGSYKVALNGQSNGYITGRNTSFENKFYITSNGVSYLNGGKVGIGTTSPADELHVAGPGRTGIRLGGPNTSGGAVADLEFRPSNGGNVGGANYWIWSFRTDSWSNTPGDLALYSHNGSSYTSPLIVQADGDVALVSGKNAPRKGNVGIGTLNPDSKLTVNGNIHAEEVKVDLNVPGPDYVFREDYNLKSLEEVQNHINEHGHLPNIPSAKEMETNGIKVGEMNMKLLEKIEELTLYVIELNKNYVELKKENSELKSMIQRQ